MEIAKTLSKGQWKIETLKLPNTIKLRYGLFCENPENVEHYIVFLNGHGEFLEKYDYLPADLKLPPNYAFLTWDHRGQGASDGQPRLHIDDYEDLAKDAEYLVKILVGNKPYTIMAHSMGGLIALYSTMKGYLKPDRLLLSAPLFGIQHVIPESVTKFLSALASRLGLSKVYFQKKLQSSIKFQNNIFTYSQERFERRFQSPYMIEGVTFGWIRSTFEAIDYIRNEGNLAQFKTPTTILYGDDERLVATSAIRNWVNDAKKFSKAKVSYEELPKTRHEIFAEAPDAYTRVLDRTRSCILGAS